MESFPVSHSNSTQHYLVNSIKAFSSVSTSFIPRNPRIKKADSLYIFEIVVAVSNSGPPAKKNFKTNNMEEKKPYTKFKALEP